MSPPPVVEQLVEQLAPFLGAFNAKISVKTFSQRALGRAADQLTKDDVPALLEALRPSLYTLVGRASTDTLLEKIARQVK
jgi:hypothetical protein